MKEWIKKNTKYIIISLMAKAVSKIWYGCITIHLQYSYLGQISMEIVKFLSLERYS